MENDLFCFIVRKIQELDPRLDPYHISSFKQQFILNLIQLIQYLLIKKKNQAKTVRYHRKIFKKFFAIETVKINNQHLQLAAQYSEIFGIAVSITRKSSLNCFFEEKNIAVILI